jgi:CxxC motif-containing protein
MDKVKRMNMTCIICPEGCKMEVLVKGRGVDVSGHKCKKGPLFAADEVLNPQRILTTTMEIESEDVHRIAVRSSAGVPKDKLVEMIGLLRKTRLCAPVKMGDVIIADILGSGANIIASSSVDK